MNEKTRTPPETITICWVSSYDLMHGVLGRHWVGRLFLSGDFDPFCYHHHQRVNSGELVLPGLLGSHLFACIGFLLSSNFNDDAINDAHSYSTYPFSTTPSAVSTH